MPNITSGIRRRTGAMLLATVLIAAGADAQTKIKSGFNLFSPEQDAEIGAQSAAEAERQLPMMNDREVEAYVNQIGQRLAAQAGGPRFNYQFHVVNASDINAFALPGGYVYVNRGVLEQSRNEGEVAGVLAHEIAHVALRHGTHQASKAYAAQAGLSILGGILGGRVGQGTANIINAVGGFGLNAVFLKFSRDLESQADIRGAQILAASGYTPADMVSFFQTLEKVDKSKKTNWLSDHPAPPDRIARIQQEARLLRVSNTPTENVAQLAAVQSRLRTYGAAPTMAQIARGTAPQQPRRTSRTQPMDVRVEAPASSLNTFTSRSGVYRVSYPANWEVYQQGDTGVLIAPRGGVGDVSGRTEIVYGAVINHYDPFGNVQGSRFRSRGGEISMEQATEDLLAQVRNDSPHLSVIRNSRQQLRTTGGARALAVALRGTNPETGIDERVTIVTRQLADQHLIYLLFVTPERDARNYGGVLQSMVNSLQVAEARAH